MATALPAASSFTGSSVTEAQFKTAITDMRTYLSDLLGTDGTEATALAALQALLGNYATKTGAYTVTSSDRGALINCTSGTFSVTTPAAATVGAGFHFGVVNTGTGTITIDGNASETVDGAATKDLEQYESAIVVSDGTNWATVAGAGAAGKSTFHTITDTSDRAVTSAFSVITGAQNIDLPSSCIIKVVAASLRSTTAATAITTYPGLKIGGTDYQLAASNETLGGASFSFQGAGTTEDYYGVGNTASLFTVHSAVSGFTTGASVSVQVVLKGQSGQSTTIKGTTFTTRFVLEVIDLT